VTNDELRARLEPACDTPAFPGILSFRAMFGGVTAYVDDRNFASLSNVGLAFKLSSAQGRDLLKIGGKMLQYDENAPASKTAVVVPEPMLNDVEALRKWAVRSAVYAKSLPPAVTRKPRSY
jgi:TfoX/Sxy family transcriptional regulator of competence genes